MHVSYVKGPQGYLTGILIEDPDGEPDPFFVRIRSANRVADSATRGCQAGGRCQPSWPSEIWRKGLSARSC